MEKKGNKLGSIRKENYNKPVAEVSVDKLQSDQSVLVPQFSIWSTQVMVDHCSDLTYLHLIIRTSQEEKLVVKLSFGRWATTFGVKVHIYHANNYFLNNPSDHQLRIPTRQ